MTILVLVGLSTTMMFRGVTQAWSRGQLGTERYQQARLLFDVFAREIASSVANSRYPMKGIDATETRVGQGSLYDELFFVGTLPGRAGLVERGYWVNARHELMCHDQEPADGTYATGTDERCGRDVFQFDLAYFNGTSWLDRWEATDGSLPKAIQLTITIGQQHPERFQTVVDVPTS